MAQVIARLVLFVSMMIGASGGLVFWFSPRSSGEQIAVGVFLFFVAIFNLIVLTLSAALDIRRGQPDRGEDCTLKGTAHAPSGPTHDP
jgi:hypothetical protein